MRAPKEYHDAAGGAADGEATVVVVDSWRRSTASRRGTTCTIGAVGETKAESEAILLEHDVQTAPFSAGQACLPTKGWTIPPEEVDRRLDLRNGRALVLGRPSGVRRH